ncbi:MAG TPA: ABC transporter permease, partial [Enterococcus sp.]|nr:ABC transporter permease [Enterococcus sp.]
MSKIKKIGLFLLPVFMLFIQFIPLKTVLAETTDPYYEKIQQKGELIVGLSADYARYEFHAEIDGKDTIVGFDISIAQKIADD